MATPGYVILGEVETLLNNLCEKPEYLDSKEKYTRRMVGAKAQLWHPERPGYQKYWKG